jgi:two-component system NtrC family sensor kinase
VGGDKTRAAQLLGISRRTLERRVAEWAFRADRLAALCAVAHPPQAAGDGAAAAAGVLPLLGVVLLVWGNAALDRLLITKVRSDLAVAHGYFERVQGEVAASTGAVADSQALHAALSASAMPDAALLRQLLRRYQQREGLDFINLRSADGQLLLADFDGAALDAGVAAPLAVGTADPDRRTTATLAVLSPAQQGLLSSALRARVAVPLVATRNAQPTQRTHEDRAMVLQASAPVRDAAGRVMAWVQAGLLLNRNLPFIDHINAIVYPDGALPFGSQGTATLFLDDVRISTNVRLFDDDGSAAGAGRTARHRHAGVDGGARCGAGPRQHLAGPRLRRQRLVRVGLCAAGRWRRPARGHALRGLPGAAFHLDEVRRAGRHRRGVLRGDDRRGAVSARWARQIFRPLEQMAHHAADVEAGALQARVGPVPGGDEIGALAGHLDHLLDTIADKTAALQRWNAELDAKVAQRTEALERPHPRAAGRTKPAAARREDGRGGPAHRQHCP